MRRLLKKGYSRAIGESLRLGDESSLEAIS